VRPAIQDLPTDRPLHRLGSWIALGVWLALLATILIDRMAQPWRPLLAWCGIALLALVDCPSPRREGGALRRRLAVAGLGALLSTILAIDIGMLVDRAPQAINVWYLRARHELWHDFWTDPSPLLILATWWFAAPFVIDAWRARREPRARTAEALTRRHALWLLAWAFWIGVAMFASIRPDRAYYRFPQEMGLHAPLFLFWIRRAGAAPDLQRRLARIAPWMMGAALLAGLVVAIAYVTGDWNRQVAIGRAEIWRTELVERQYINGWQWRLNFPLGHHNRMGFFSMLTALLLLMAARRRGGWMRWVAVAAMLVALATLGFSLNRGSFLALVAGLMVMTVLWLGRRAAWLLLLLPAAWLAMSDLQRQQVLSLVDRETYRSPQSTVVTRLDHWRLAARLIRENPVFGIGYSWRHFEEYAEDYAKQVGAPVYEKAHAHNYWLQTAAETGLPGMLLYLGWTIGRWSLLLALVRRRRRLPAGERGLIEGWCGVEAAIQVYCLGNLPLRLGLGLLTWGIWAVMWVDLVRLWRAAQDPAGVPSETS